jgi:hypothetical protein
MKRDTQSEIQAKKFKSYHKIWVETSGQYQACDWMAAHIGHLVANVDRIQKQVRKLEKAMSAGHKSKRVAATPNEKS